MAIGDGHPRVARSVERQFWRHVRAGLSPAEAAAAVGVSQGMVQRWFRDGGGMPTLSLAEPTGRCLTLEDREEIAVGIAAGETDAQIARRIERPRSTVSRELERNRPRYPDGRAVSLPVSGALGAAQGRGAGPPAEDRQAGRHPWLREFVQGKLECEEHWSPEQIARRLPTEFPDDEGMRICHETIYQAIYVQGRGGLRRELASCLRTGRAIRKPRRRTAERRGRIPNMVLISERPAEVEDRVVPGHWEGDLIVGKDNGSAIGTLVERTTRFTLLLHLQDQTAATVRDAIEATITTLPATLRRSLTWDQGRELAAHLELRLATNLEVYFCDPHSPWQRGTNENTNGLLRQYFPKGTDLSKHSPQRLAEVAAGLNGRPRKTLGWRTPFEAFNDLLLSA